jgi:PAS domain S-box-containing protein
MTGIPVDSAARMAAIVESADDAIVSHDLSGMITSWNPAAERLFGYGAGEVVGQHVFLIVPEDCRPTEADVLDALREGEGSIPYDATRLRKDGGVIEVSITASPLRDHADRVVGIITIARDISSRKNAERDAMRLAAIVESSDDAIISKDLNGVILTWNRGAERMFGYTATEAIGRSITMIIPNNRMHEEVEVLRRVRAGILVAHFETVRHHKDGHEVEISLSVSPIRDASRKIVGASKIARDISEQKRLRRMADEVSRMKDEFLAVLSHELRTPLNTVLGYARMLRHPQISDDQKKRTRALTVLERNADALAKLVDEVLDTARSMAGKLQLATQRVDLDSIVREALDTMTPAAQAKSITLEVSSEPRLETLGDPDRLRQVVLHLIANAVKFTPPKGKVSVRVFGDYGEVVIEIQDTGIGIGPEQVTQVFQRFWQADASVSREHGGLGLGLALVRHLVEMHGGTVSAASAGKGKGARFTVRLKQPGLDDRVEDRIEDRIEERLEERLENPGPIRPLTS